MNKNAKIFVAGHKGLVGSSIIDNLQQKGFINIIVADREECDLINQSDVETFFAKEKPEYVILAAAKVGGIIANNTYRADFIYQNLMIQNNIIHQCYLHGVKKLLFLGSSCIYPKNSPQPMNENHLLTSELEFTNEPYAIAKIAGIKMCESYNLQYNTNFISVMPTNLYGYNDNFDLEKSHVLPALIRKMHLGKALMINDFDTIRKDLNKNPIKNVTGNSDKNEILAVLTHFGITSGNIELWGTGKPRREFLHADDLADACVYLLDNLDFKDILSSEYDLKNPEYPITTKEIRNTHINIGVGYDYTINELAEIIREIVGYEGAIKWNAEKPDGTFQKLMNVDKLKSYGWKEKINFVDGIKLVYQKYQK